MLSPTSLHKLLWLSASRRAVEEILLSDVFSSAYPLLVLWEPIFVLIFKRMRMGVLSEAKWLIFSFQHRSGSLLIEHND